MTTPAHPDTGRRSEPRSSPTAPSLRLGNVSLQVPGRTLLANAGLELAPGEVVALLGPSGSGKTSILNVAAGIAEPDTGIVEVAGQRLSGASWTSRCRHRLARIGQVFQFSELLPELPVRENVALPLLLAGRRKPAAFAAADEALDRVSMGGFAAQWPELMSGGECQRVAIARAIVAAPAIVLADEPTGALDEANSRLIGELFVEIARTTSCGVLIGTHDPLVAAVADRVVRIEDARLVER